MFSHEKERFFAKSSFFQKSYFFFQKKIQKNKFILAAVLLFFSVLRSIKPLWVMDWRQTNLTSLKFFINCKKKKNDAKKNWQKNKIFLPQIELRRKKSNRSNQADQRKTRFQQFEKILGRNKNKLKQKQFLNFFGNFILKN